VAPGLPCRGKVETSAVADTVVRASSIAAWAGDSEGSMLDLASQGTTWTSHRTWRHQPSPDRVRSEGSDSRAQCRTTNSPWPRSRAESTQSRSQGLSTGSRGLRVPRNQVMHWFLGFPEVICCNAFGTDPSREISVKEDEPAFHEVHAGDVGPVVDALTTGGQRPVLVVLGGADGLERTAEIEFERSLRLGIVPLMRDMKAIVIDGGTDSGVMRTIGRTFGEIAPECTLVGVAPAGRIQRQNGQRQRANRAQGSFLRNCRLVQRWVEKSDGRVEPAPNHNHIVLAAGNDWGCELDALIALIDRLSDASQVLVLVVGGGKHTRAELDRVYERGWPVLILVETGGHADRTYRRARFRYAGMLGKIAKLPKYLPLALYKSTNYLTREERQIEFRHVRDHQAIRRSINWRFQGEGLIVRLAWERVAAYEELSQFHRPVTRWLMRAVLAFGVLTTIAGLTFFIDWWAEWISRFALIALPFVSTSILGIVMRWKRHSSWLLVRVAAESLKQDIYQYRCKVGPYVCGDREEEGGSREEVLALRLEAVDKRLMMDVPTATARSAPRHWPPPALDEAAHRDDLLLEDLAIADYVRLRIRHQLEYYDAAVHREDRWLKLGVVVVALFALLSVLSASFLAPDASSGIALAATLAAVSTAIAASMTYGQTEQHVSKMSRAAVGLRAALLGFVARGSHDESAEAQSVVTASEEALAQENEEWYRSLQQSVGMFVRTHGV
jgi:hypothetical protein